MTTSEPVSSGGEESHDHELTLFAVDFHARTSATLANAPALKASTADYGLTSPQSFATFDPVTSSWRTPLASLLGDSVGWSETWPQAGTTRSGTAYRLRPSAPHTYERASGFWPTPLRSEAYRGIRTKRYSQGGKPLTYVLGGQPNPPWLAWLMGFSADWTDIETEPSATPSSRKSPNTSAG